jgi:phosphohistidine phosphatase
MADHLRASDIRPTLVLCSSARRTRETLEAVSPGGATTIEPELYEASAAWIIERLRNVPDQTESAMVIGHNPAMQILVLRLAGAHGLQLGNADLSAVQRKFPTGALATLAFDGAWSDLAPGGAELVSFVRPRALR